MHYPPIPGLAAEAGAWLRVTETEISATLSACVAPETLYSLSFFASSAAIHPVDAVCAFSCRLQNADIAGPNLVAAVPSLLPLPCGGYGVSSLALPLSSVYRAAGPVLYNVTITAGHTTVVAGQTVELVATVHSVAPLTMPLGKLMLLIAYRCAFTLVVQL